MKTGTLQRLSAKAGDWGTPGNVSIENGAFAMCLYELPWRGDAPDVSCLAPGPSDAAITYLLKNQPSASFRRDLYHFVGVLGANGNIDSIPGGRLNCMLHNGNLAGDILKNYLSQVEGCGLCGQIFATFQAGQPFAAFTRESPAAVVTTILPQNQPGVAASVLALNAFMDYMGGEDLVLTVSWI